MVGDQAGGETALLCNGNRRKRRLGVTRIHARRARGKGVGRCGNEDLQLPDDGRVVQENGPGPAPGIQTHGKGPVGEAGPSWAAGNDQLTEVGGPKREGPTAPLEKAGLLGCFSSRKGTFSEDPLMSLVLEESRREQRDVGLSMTDRVLEEEAKRYASFSHPKGKRAVGTPLLLFSNSDRAPEGESFDRPGDGSWKLGEVNKNSDVARGKEGNNGGFGSQHTENEKEDLWEEGSLAKFSQFLGFSTEGLEKEILSFLIKIRKRREKIHSKELLEKTKFERELKRLECSVNYEGGLSRKGQGEPVDSCPMKMKIITWNETKIQEMSEGIVRSLGSGRFLDWRALNAEGAAGGILICWDKRVLEILDWEEGQFSLSCRFKTIENGATWVFTGVYGPFTKVEREGMWEELGAIRGLWDDPWCLGGDFNITLFQHERSSQRRTSSAMRRFAEFVDDLELAPSGGRVHMEWGLSRPTSDHFPIVLEGGGIRRGPTPFRFENMWLKVEGFNDIVRTWWQGIEVRGSASYRLAVKMKEIKKKLKVWNKEVFGRLETNKASALHQVDFWDRVESERVLSMEEAELKKEAKDSFKKWVLLEEAHWRQHSRELWLKDGDKNTGFFHRMASAHRRHNAMDRIKADIGSIPVGCISLQDAESLETPFAENEIHSALMEMNGDKAPGPDGFTVAFWQDAWDFAKEEIMEMFKEFHEHSSFVKSLNNTFLVLIPKKSGAENLGDFRPISLNAFVKGRQILDASLIANEVIDSWQKRKEKGLICKLDIEKAYDSINWKFLMKVLQKMGFGPKWMGWMWSCVSSAKFSILVNGVPAGFFPSTRGLRQGDPLSPYLFVMGMEVLDVLIRRCKEQVSHLSWILFWFEAASGLRINLAKSEIIPVGDVEDILELAAELGGRVGSLPSHYLGLPLGVPNRATSMWDGVEERIRRRLALWKRHLLLKEWKKPKRFPMGGGNLEGKVHLVKWDAVCTEKHKGGLGLRRIATLNRALLGKWIWRFACEKNNFWNQVITTKYGQEDYGWRPKKVRGAAGVGVWKEIMKESDWDATIEEMWDQDSGQGDWKLVFVRDFNDWEMDMVGELLHTLRGYRPSLEDDSVVWRQEEMVFSKSKKLTGVGQA
ncbi:Retrovirus-related Pol polyprotein from type-1 retrotransposable element R2 [Vitis vinifera]|uniref:Retrovirus-related Pol polyprotein from type-1 retrotransposable element R2 n=1 Tax=Vitis vinifera TaxID=29760 RepID=A0A438E0A3_VITVI|nr:Retrovirus-related Pol polyprotein from type-1 retrotransposable element R2 [Vitis vinifera]